MLMAGLTDGSRKIHAKASDMASHVFDLSEDGFVSLRLQGSGDIYLQQQGRQLVAEHLQESNADGMAATFRILDASTR